MHSSFRAGNRYPAEYYFIFPNPTVPIFKLPGIFSPLCFSVRSMLPRCCDSCAMKLPISGSNPFLNPFSMLPLYRLSASSSLIPL